MSPIVTGIPTDVNWAESQRLDVSQLSLRDSDVKRSDTRAREFSDAISELLYNLDNTIDLRAKPDQQPRNLSKTQYAYMETWR
jgi:hypothetical protein